MSWRLLKDFSFACKFDSSSSPGCVAPQYEALEGKQEKWKGFPTSSVGRTIGVYSHVFSQVNGSPGLTFQWVSLNIFCMALHILMMLFTIKDRKIQKKIFVVVVVAKCNILSPEC